MSASVPSPDSVIMVGGGIVGLSTAWYLQEHGIEITVVDRAPVGGGPATGASGVTGLVSRRPGVPVGAAAHRHG